MSISSKFPHLIVVLLSIFVMSNTALSTTINIDMFSDSKVSNYGCYNGFDIGSNNACNDNTDLRGALNHINRQPTAGDYTIEFTSPNQTLSISAVLPIVNLAAGNTITIAGNGITVSGADTYPGFFARQGALTLQNMVIQNCIAQGGNGGSSSYAGGAGLGAGAGLFIDQADVTISSVTFQNNQAKGGNGGSSTGSSAKGAGGGGMKVAGQSGSGNNFSGTGGGIGSDAIGGISGTGNYAQGGAAGTTGGFAGGGGGSSSGTPGSGGFGGGGGGAKNSAGGAGGFGSGSGAGGTSGTGGIGGGNGSSGGGGGHGGGGAGLGAAIFNRNGTLTINSITTSGNSVTAGNAGGNGASSGSAAGTDIFLATSSTNIFAPASSATITLANPLVDETQLQNGGTSQTGATITINGAGTVAMNAANTYKGGTTLQAGTLQIGNSNALLSGTGLTFAGNAILKAGTDTLSVGNSIILSGHAATIDTNSYGFTLAGATASDAGSITKIGTGTLTLSGANAHTGGTTINAGTIALFGSGTLAPTGTVTLGGGTLDISTSTNQTIGDLSATGGTVTLGSHNLTFGTGNDTSLAAAVSGTGTMIKTGSGKTSLSSNVISTPMTINSGTLAGVGTISGLLTNNATVAPGNSPGIITTNNYTASSDSILSIAIQPSANPVAGTDYSKLAVTNTATLNNSTLNFVPTDGTYIAGTQYEFLTAGTLNGTFGTVNYSRIGGYTAQVSYTGTSATLTLLQNSMSSNLPNTASSSNRVISSYLDGLSATNGNDLSNVLGIMDGLSGNDLTAALNSIDPTRNLNSNFMIHDTSRMVNAIHTTRMDIIRSYSNHPGLASSHMTSFAARPEGTNLTESGVKDGVINTVNKDDLLDHKSTAWFYPYAFTSHQTPTAQITTGYNAKTGGIVAGIDHLVNHDFLLGVGTGYSNTNVVLSNNSGSSRFDSYFATLYGSFTKAKTHIDLSCLVGLNKLHNARNIVFSTINRTARANSNSYNLTPTVRIGYDLTAYKNIVIEPFGAVDYTMNHNQGYTETGADSLDHMVQSHDSQILRQELGFNFITDINQQAAFYKDSMMKFKISYVHRKAMNVNNVSATLIGETGGFITSGSEIPQKLLSLGLEGIKKLSDSSSIGLHYNNELSRRYNSHELSLQLNYKF